MKNEAPAKESDLTPYRKFEAGLKQILSVSKEELDRRIQAEKEEVANPKPTSSK